MKPSTPVERIRQAIAWQLRSLGVRNASSLHESILIHNGIFCGRKFQCEEYEVVWFLEEDEIKFFSPFGELLKATSAIACIQALEAQQNLDDRRAA